MKYFRCQGLMVMLGWWLLGTVALSAEPTLLAYFPLAVGNRWVYESSEGTAAMPVTESWEVIGEKGNAFVMRITQPYITTENLEEVFFATTEGIQRLAGETEHQETPNAGPQFFLKGPLAAGATWKNESGRYAITAVDEVVTVPAGTFPHCVEVTHWSTGGSVTVVSLYAPDVGMVQREERFRIIGGIGGFDAPQQGRTILRLKEWKINDHGSRIEGLEPQGQSPE